MKHDGDVTREEVHDKMDYIYHCYMTRRFHLELRGKLKEGDSIDFEVVNAKDERIIDRLEVPLRLKEEKEFVAMFKKC